MKRHIITERISSHWKGSPRKGR